MRPRSVSLSAALLTVLVTGCAWTQWGGGAEHRGANAVPNLTTASAGTWVSHEIVDIAATTPVVDANGILFVVRDGRLLAVDPGTGAVVWAADLPAGATAGGVPAVDTSKSPVTVFVSVATPTHPEILGFDVGGIRNCNPTMFTCAPVFRAVLGTAPGPPTPLLVHNGRVFGHGATDLEAFDAHGTTGCTTTLGTATCAPRWSAPLGTPVSGIGPTATDNGTVYDTGTLGSVPTVFAINEVSGARRWTGSLDGAATATPSIGGDGRVAVPAGTVVDAFAGGGCGTATCVPSFTWTGATAAVRSTPAFDGPTMYATSANGELLTWPAGGCGSAVCPAATRTTVDRPTVADGQYQQSPVITGGMVLLLARRSVSGVDHAFAVALAESDRSEVAAWDLGAGGFASGLANASLNGRLVVAPVAAGLFAVGPPTIRPLASLSTSELALSPAFDPSISDYTVRCVDGPNELGLAAAAVPGGTVRLVAPVATAASPTLSTNVSLTPNQAAVIEAAAAGATSRTWIRCLPPDFPTPTLSPHAEVGTATPGWYVLSNNLAGSGTHTYAMVLDAHGTPVWYKRGNPTATNVTPVAPNTIAFMPTPAIAFSTDPTSHFDVYSLAAGTVKSIQTVGVTTDQHEFQTLPNGDHLLVAYPLKGGLDLTGLVGNPSAGPNSTIADCAVQEVDPSGHVVFDWRASDHIDPVTETTTAATAVTVGTQTVYDVYHCNSIDPHPNGNLLVSARHANMVFEIRRSDGRILWKLGGTPVNKDGAAIIAIQNDPDGGPVQQHDARYMANGHISMFDNQSGNVSARGIEYAVDLTNHTASPVFSFASPLGQASCCMGDFRTEPDGHRVIGYGFMFFGDGLAMTELDAAGADVLDLRLAPGNGEYRVVKVPPTFFDADVLRQTAGT